MYANRNTNRDLLCRMSASAFICSWGYSFSCKIQWSKIRPLRHQWLISWQPSVPHSFCILCFSKANTAGQLLLVSQSLSKISIVFLQWKSSTGFKKVVPTVVLRQPCQFHNLRNHEPCIFVIVSLSEVLSMCLFFSIHFCSPSQKKYKTKYKMIFSGTNSVCVINHEKDFSYLTLTMCVLLQNQDWKPESLNKENTSKGGYEAEESFKRKVDSYPYRRCEI